MDPASFTKTSFCGKEVDNITENESKEYILNQMTIRCSGIKYRDRYAKVYNTQYAKNLRNPHIVCLKSSGTPYLMFLTQINETNYCFLIDKKIKEGYSYPKIFILPFHFHSDLYKGSLFECELLRDHNKRWSILIGDSYYCYGKNRKNTIIMDRMNELHQMMTEKYTESEFTKTCPIHIKRYFDYRDIREILDTFVKTLTYDIRGLYFVPLRCSYSRILMMFPKNNTSNAKHPQSQVNAKNSSHKSQNANKSPNNAKNPNNPHNPQAKPSNHKTFRILKTMKPDVYELYTVVGEDFEKIGLALVQTKETSRYLFDLFREKTMCSEVLVNCRYNESFGKWEPIC